MKTLLALAFAVCAAAVTVADTFTSDIVVYGGSPAALSAAVQAKRMGATCIVVCPDRRIGGLTTGGLGQTDIGNKSAFGGIAVEFYRDIARHYADPANWKWQKPAEYRPDGQCAGSGNAETMWTFEPSAALKVLEGWEKRDGLTIHRGRRLDRSPGKVRVEGQGMQRRIVSFLTEDGTTYRGKVFVDATYEGDLMAAAGVSYTVGREGNDVYSETVNGIQRRQGHHKFEKGVSAYVVEGDPSSGLLPFVEPDDVRPDGSGDNRVQAYCFRMCLTDVPENRIPFKKPAGYKPLDYELLIRNLVAQEKAHPEWQGTTVCWKGMPWIDSRMPNRKTDANNRSGFSTDFIGQNHRWPDADYEERERILRAHLAYQQGLMWTLANDPRVPARIRNEFARWGTCRDEFADGFGDGWQRQLYVREARRMKGAYVMTERHCRWGEKAPHPVAMAAYQLDSHHCRRYVDANGFVQNEGDVEVPTLPDGKTSIRPYGIDYGSLTPKRAECVNLLVPVCISASHMAYGSIRMEPVFFALGQAAGTAASMAAQKGVAVQDVPYDELARRLHADGQVFGPVPPPAYKARGVRNFTAKDFACERADGRTEKSIAWAMQRVRRMPRPEMPSDLKTAADFPAWKARVAERERKRLNVPDDVRAPFRELSVVRRKGYSLHTLEFYPDDVMAVKALLLVPDTARPGKTPAVVCMPGSGASLESLAGEPAAHFTRYPLRNRQGWWYAQAGFIALCLENPVSGDNCHDDMDYWTQLNKFRHLIATLGWCEQGVATREVLACVEWLKAHPLVDPKKIALSALSRGCQLAWAALFSDDVAALVYNDFVCSGTQLQMCVTDHAPRDVQGGVDRIYPEPDVLAALAPKPVLFSEGGHWKGVVSEIARAYELAGKPDNFTLRHYAKYADKAKRPHDDMDLRTASGLTPDDFLALSNCDPKQHSFHPETALPWLCRVFGQNAEFTPELKAALAKAVAEREVSATVKAKKAKPYPPFSRKRLFPGFDGKLCKVQPSIATDGKGLAILGYQKLLLTGSDVFFGQYLSKSTDGGETWSEPKLMEAFKDTHEDGLRVTRYATVYYSRVNRRWYGLGQACTYKGDSVPNADYSRGKPYSWPLFVNLNPVTATYSEGRPLDFPLPYAGCLPFGQQVEEPNGDILVPFYYEPLEKAKPSNDAFLRLGRIVVARCRFEGDMLKIVQTGRPVACDGLRRGVGEPSLVRFGQKVYMTVRSDEAGMWCESDDGLNYTAPRRWTWTDGVEIGNRNTQQHWMWTGDTVYLAYTRETPANGHVFRNRAPVFLAAFDPAAGGLVRETEIALVPELGARLGNFCCAPDGKGGSWLVTAEWMQPAGCEKYGSDNSLWLIRPQ